MTNRTTQVIKQPFLFHLDPSSKVLLQATSDVTGMSMAAVIRQMICHCTDIVVLNQLFPNSSGNFSTSVSGHSGIHMEAVR